MTKNCSQTWRGGEFDSKSPLFAAILLSPAERLSVVLLITGHARWAGIVFAAYSRLEQDRGVDAGAVAEVFPRLRQHLPKLPIGVGFGIRDAASAKAVAQVADAVVIGSALVQLVERAGPDNAATELRDFLRVIRQALDEENPA